MLEPTLQQPTTSPTEPLAEAAAPSREAPASGTDRIFAEVEQQYMPSVMIVFRELSSSMAQENGRKSPEYVDVFRAFESYFSGKSADISHRRGSRGLFDRENIFLIVVSLMTILFGLMGLAPLFTGTEDASKLGYKPDLFLDIAKLFAGVVIGGAAGAAAGAAASQRRPG